MCCNVNSVLRPKLAAIAFYNAQCPDQLFHQSLQLTTMVQQLNVHAVNKDYSIKYLYWTSYLSVTGKYINKEMF